MTIEKIFNLSLKLKEDFRAVERKEWSSSQYLIELFVQVGHLSDILLRQEYKLNKHNEDDNKKIIGDELGDIVLNVISICEDLGIKIDLVKIIDGSNNNNAFNYEDILKNLFIDLGDLSKFLVDGNYERVSELSIIIINKCYLLANIFDINLDGAFEDLYHDSLVFIAKHSLPERSQDASVVESNFTEEVEEILLDESLREHFLKDLPDLDLKDNLQTTPFLIVRPSAVNRIEEIISFLVEKNVKIGKISKIDNFETLARYLYPVSEFDSNSYMWFILTRAKFPKLFDTGYIIFLDESYKQKYDQVYKIKTDLKNMLGINRYKLSFEGRDIETNLHHIHSPDSSSFDKEYALIDYFLNFSD